MIFSYPLYLLSLASVGQPQPRKSSSYQGFSNHSQMAFQSEHKQVKGIWGQREMFNLPSFGGTWASKWTCLRGLRVNPDQSANEFSYCHQRPCNSSRLANPSGHHLTPACGPMSQSLSSSCASVSFLISEMLPKEFSLPNWGGRRIYFHGSSMTSRFSPGTSFYF